MLSLSVDNDFKNIESDDFLEKISNTMSDIILDQRSTLNYGYMFATAKVLI